VSFEALEGAGLKTSEEVMEILEAFDATGSLRDAAELVGCDQKTVGHWVRARDEAGAGLSASVPRDPTTRSTSRAEEPDAVRACSDPANADRRLGRGAGVSRRAT
jgi:hypothetical protein